MSLSFGLDNLISKHRLNFDNPTHFNVQNAKSLFDVSHNDELLKKEQSQFLKQHLFSKSGGFPDKKFGLPGIKTFDAALPNVLKEIHNEDAESSISNEKIAEFVAENKDLILDHEQSEDYMKVHVQHMLRNKSRKAKENELNKRLSGKGKPVFTIKNNEIQLKIEPKVEPKIDQVDTSIDEMKIDDSNVEEKKQAENELDDEPGNITKNQKEKMKDILGENFKELKAKPKQKVSIIIINPDGQILHKV